MPIQFQKNCAIFKGVVAVDDAEVLLGWIQKKTAAKVDLTHCEHLHTANLQVLMAARPNIVAWPEDMQFQAWLKSALF